jgi:hypothetical protein
MLYSIYNTTIAQPSILSCIVGNWTRFPNRIKFEEPDQEWHSRFHCWNDKPIFHQLNFFVGIISP